MKKLRPTPRFKKDYKAIVIDPVKVAAFKRVAELLKAGKPLPVSCQAHYIKGQYQGHLECHIGPDYLLIWVDGDIIDLVRIGSHSKLFKK